MPIGPAQLAGSLGALDGLEVDQGLEVTLPQVLGSAKTLLAADRAVLMLIDQTGALRWASGSDRMVKAVASDLSMPIHVGGGPVGTLNVYVSAPREWTTVSGRPCRPMPGCSRTCSWPRRRRQSRPG